MTNNTATWQKLSEAFYSRVARDPRLKPLFPGKSLRCATEEMTAFLVQFFGGPTEDTQKRWWLSLKESHSRFKIGEHERAAWLENMRLALQDAELPAPMRETLETFFARSSGYVSNANETPSPLQPEIETRWRTQCEVDRLVEAVRKGEATHAIALAESPLLGQRFKQDRSVFTFLLAIMAGTSHEAMLEYVRGKLTADPSLVHQRYASRTLLHETAGLGVALVVSLLLQLGADANELDAGGHTPLYWLANGSAGSGGATVVRTLVEHGADVNACGGVKRCTPLHMAARRGSVEIAEALLDHGAALEARDSLGETPLRRAVNCGRTGVTQLLLGRGADVHSLCRKGVSPLSAARTPAMRTLLLSRSMIGS